MPSWKVSHIFGSELWQKTAYEPLGVPAQEKSSASSHHLKCWIRHCSIFAVYTVIFTFSAVWYLSYPVAESGLIYSTHESCKKNRKHSNCPLLAPARSALVPEIQTYNASIWTPFHGPPSLETDAAWHELIACESCFILLKNSIIKKITIRSKCGGHKRRPSRNPSNIGTTPRWKWLSHRY